MVFMDFLKVFFSTEFDPLCFFFLKQIVIKCEYLITLHFVPSHIMPKEVALKNFFENLPRH